MAGTSADSTVEEVFRLSNSVKPVRYHLQFDIPFHTHAGPMVRAVSSVAEVFCTNNGAVSSFSLHSLGLVINSVRVIATSSAPADRSHEIVKEIMANKLASPISQTATTFETVCDSPMNPTGPLALTIELPPNVEYVGDEIPVQITEDKINEAIILQSATPFPPNFSVLVHYTAPLASTCSDDTKALFCSLSENGNFIGTQLEPTLARCLYPCFDEPSFKANFQLCLFVHPSYQATSNTAIRNIHKIPREMATGRFSPSEEVEVVEGTSSVQMGSTPTTDTIGTISDVWRYRYTFYETPRLSPCLVAFTTGDFHVLETETKRGLSTRVIFPKNNNINSGWFAVDLLKKAIEFFENFFNFELPVTKVDIVALHDMRNLGMENWGMITLNAAYCLVDEKTSLERRQRIARLIGHEVAHQWFGNIVSIAWWDEIWLKEGFCRYLEFVFVHQIFPKWQIWGEFISKISDTALCMDCNPDVTHPVLCSVGNPRRIFDMFDTISYAKGASILRMVASLVGDRVMAQALTSLVHTHAYGNFTTSDFLDAIKQHYTDASVDVEALVTQLITVPNHPLLYVELDPEGNYKVSQFEMPNLVSGLLPALIESKIVKMNPPPAATPFVIEMKSASSFSPLSPHRNNLPVEFTVDPRGRFPNDPSEWLLMSDYTVPIRAVTLIQGQTSSSRVLYLTKNVTTIQMGKQALEDESSAPVLYFNFSGCGVFRCDFETKIWKQIFAVAPYLTHIDRLTITLSLFRFRTIHMGVTPHDDEDRSTLLLQWLLNFSAGHPQQLNSSIWSVIANELTPIVYFLRGSHCWDEFCQFIHHIFMPLILDGIVTLSPRENSADFQATKSISSETCFSILHLLAITKCSHFDEEARNIFKWMIASVCKITGQGAAAADLITEEHQVPFDINDDDHRSRAFAATEFLCERGNQTEWWVLLSICLQLQGMKWDELGANKRAHVPQQGNASPRTPSQVSIVSDPLASDSSHFLSGDVTMIFSPPTDFQVDVDPVFLENASYRQKLLQLLLPAVLGYDDWSTCPPIAALCLKISGMTTPMARSIIRNTNLLLEVLALGRRRISSKFLLSFCSLASSHSSNYELIVKLREFTTEALEAQHARTLASEGNIVAANVMSPLFNSLIEKSEGMDLNLAWVEYVAPHYTNYLQGLRQTLHHNRNGSDIGLTPVASYLTHAPPPATTAEDQHRSTDEVEI